MTRLLPLAAVALPFLLVGCGETEPGVTPAPAPAAAAPEAAAWRLDAAPADAVGVAAVKASAAEGDRVTMVGRIGGRAEPVSPESGLIVVMDPAVPSCADTPGDACTTPWDYCCETQEAITANAATVQLRDAAGEPIALAAADFPPLATVSFTGTVSARPNADVLVVVADAVHVQPR